MISSDAYTFVVSPLEKEFTIHADAIATLSPSLRSLLKNDSFAESHTKRIVWDDIETDTFIRFCQYAYTGDYEDEPPSEPVGMEDALPAGNAGDSTKAEVDKDDLELVEEFMWPQFARRQQGRGKQWRCVQCKSIFYDSEMSDGCPRCPSQFYSKHYPFVDQGNPFGMTTDSDNESTMADAKGDFLEYPRNETVTSKRTQAIKAAALNPKACGDLPGDDMGKVVGKTSKEIDQYADPWGAIFDHTKLYLLAEKWNVSKLMTLTLRKMQLCLDEVGIEEDEAALPALFDLVRLAYENTASGKDPLRGLVTHFVAAEIMHSDMGRRKGFMSLLEDMPDFAKAIWTIVYRVRMV